MIYGQACRTPWQHLLADSAASVNVRVPSPFCVLVLHCCFIENGVQSSEDVVKCLDVYEESEGVWNIRHSGYNNKIKRDSAIIIIIIIIMNCNWVVTRWQWLFYMHTKHEIGYY